MPAQVDHSTRPWNHNIHYGRIVMAALPLQCRSALDLGCGEGWLTGALARAVPVVVGLDRDEPSVFKARSNHPSASFVVADLLEAPLPSARFDFVASVAALHHVDLEPGLAQMRRLVSPGGVIVIVGLAQSGFPVDLPIEAAGAIANLFFRWFKGYTDTTAPKVPPTMSHLALRRAAGRSLSQAPAVAILVDLDQAIVGARLPGVRG